MAGPWLYAISERAGMHWELENKKPPVSIASYEKLLKTGELTQDKWWGISQNWKNVRPNDEVFIYTGDDDHSIIGYGTILGSNGEEAVRQWVHFPRRNLTNLARHKAQLIRLLLWDAQ